MGYASSSNVKVVTKDTKTQVVATWQGNSATPRQIKAKTVTTVTEYRGLSKAAAEAMCDSDTYNYVNKVDYFIGEYASGADPSTALPKWWLGAPLVEGSESHATMRNLNDSSLYTVTVTLAATTCSGTHPRIYP